MIIEGKANEIYCTQFGCRRISHLNGHSDKATIEQVNRLSLASHIYLFDLSRRLTTLKLCKSSEIFQIKIKFKKK